MRCPGKTPALLATLVLVLCQAFPAWARQEEGTEAAASGTAHYATGLLLHGQGNRIGAGEELLEAVAADPGNVELLLNVTGKLLEWNMPLLARQALDTALPPGFPSVDLLLRKGEIARVLERQDEAVAAWRAAMEIDPGNVAALRRLVRTHFARRDAAAAMELLRAGASRADGGRDLTLELVRLLLQYITHWPGSVPMVRGEIEPLLERTLAWRMDTAEEALAQADGFSLLGQLERAAGLLLRYLDRTGEEALQVRDRLARLFLQLGRTARAAEQLQAILEFQPDNASAHFLLGSIAAEDGIPDKALHHHRRSIELRPDFEPPYLAIAGIHLGGRRPLQALEILGTMRSRFPKNFHCEYYAGLALASLHHHPEALRHLVEAESLAAGDPALSPSPSFHFQLGAMHERNGNLEKAQDHFLLCLDREPDDAATLNYLGYMWANEGENLEKATLWIQRALELEPENAAIIDSMGWVLFRRGKYAEALDHLLRAESLLEEPDPEVLDHLGDVHRALGREREAVRYWEKCLEIEFSDRVWRKMRAARPAPEGDR